jgi:hypothetical protein
MVVMMIVLYMAIAVCLPPPAAQKPSGALATFFSLLLHYHSNSTMALSWHKELLHTTSSTLSWHFSSFT